MSRKTELAKNTAILTVGKLCTQCISFFLLPLYTAILSTEEYGTFDLLVTYSTLLLPLVNWQLDQGLFRFMLDYRGNKEEQGKLFSTLLLSSTIQSIIYIILFVCVEPFLKIQNAYFCCCMWCCMSTRHCFFNLLEDWEIVLNIQLHRLYPLRQQQF